MAVWLPTFKLDCRACSAEQKIENGCEEDSPIPGVWKLDDWMFSRCPLKLITVETRDVIRAYSMMKLGFLPNEGGWLDQPGKLIDAFEILEREVQKAQESQVKK